MAAIDHGRALDDSGVDQVFSGLDWQPVVTVPASNFVGGAKYLVMAGISNLENAGTVGVGARMSSQQAGGNHIQLESGGPDVLLQEDDGLMNIGTTVIDSSYLRSEFTPAANKGDQYVWAGVYTQPATAEDLVLEIASFSSIFSVTAGTPMFIQWIRLDADLVENTDWFYGELATTTAMSTAWETRATITLDPPTAGDDWLILATHRQLATSITVTTSTRLVVDPAGTPAVLGGIWTDEAGDTAESEVHIHMWVVEDHGDAAITYAVEDQCSSGTVPDHTDSQILALNLSKFQQSVFAYDADEIADNASFTDITPDAWVDPTVTTTGDWWILGFFIDDVAAASEGTRPQLTIDAANEPWDHEAGHQIHSLEATAEIGGLIVTRPTLTTGVRDIKMEAIAVDGTSGAWQNRFLVGWSMELAGGAPPPLVFPWGEPRRRLNRARMTT